jgi:uncharacterized protein YndB with AHSA1/START domain
MQQPSAVHDTFILERHFPKTPDKVFAALSTLAQRRRWFAEGDNHEVEQFHSDFRIGGFETLRCRFKADAPAPVAGRRLTNEGIFQDIVPDRRIIMAHVMSLDDTRISASLVTVELLAGENGTDLILTHQGTFLEGSGGPRMREVGWQTLLNKLASEVSDSPDEAEA